VAAKKKVPRIAYVKGRQGDSVYRFQVAIWPDSGVSLEFSEILNGGQYRAISRCFSTIGQLVDFWKYLGVHIEAELSRSIKLARFLDDGRGYSPEKIEAEGGVP